jgi:hypothetical protein
MTTTVSSPVKEGQRRRVVLIDFDWQDADLLPRLLHTPGLAVRLVAGERTEDPGLRMAEVCGLPRTLDLADLTREIFDLALVSERSPRRTQVEGLLLALGTPTLTPQTFVAHDQRPGEAISEVENALELPTLPIEATLASDDFEHFIEHALPDLSDDAPIGPPRVPSRNKASLRLPGKDDFPGPEARADLEATLRSLMADTGAERAEVRVDGPQGAEIIVEVGPEDPLLGGVVELAQLHGTTHVITSVSGSPSGTAWGAWPFQTAQRRVVVAAAGIRPNRWTAWETMVAELCATWEQQRRDRAAPAFPLVPENQGGWLQPDDFLMHLELAVERHRRDGLRFALQLLDFPISAAAVDRFTERLPQHLRETDSICRPGPQRVLLLTATPRDRFPYLRGRIAALWQEAWLAAGNERPIPGIVDERFEMTKPDDAEQFLSRARRWLEAPTT